MGYSNIDASILPEDKTTIKASIDSEKTKMPFLVNLTPSERHDLRKMGANRLSYVSDLNLAANTNQQALPKNFDLTGYNKKVKLFEDLKEIYSWMTPLYEGLESTLMAVGSEVMTLSDSAYAHLKVEAEKSKDQNLNAVVKQIGEQLKQHNKSLKSKAAGQ
jgi:hypothetical protein